MSGPTLPRGRSPGNGPAGATRPAPLTRAIPSRLKHQGPTHPLILHPRNDRCEAVTCCIPIKNLCEFTFAWREAVLIMRLPERRPRRLNLREPRRRKGLGMLNMTLAARALAKSALPAL